MKHPPTIRDESPIVTIDQVGMSRPWPHQEARRESGSEPVTVISARCDLLRWELKRLYTSLQQKA